MWPTPVPGSAWTVGQTAWRGPDIHVDIAYRCRLAITRWRDRCDGAEAGRRRIRRGRHRAREPDVGRRRVWRRAVHRNGRGGYRQRQQRSQQRKGGAQSHAADDTPSTGSENAEKSDHVERTGEAGFPRGGGDGSGAGPVSRRAPRHGERRCPAVQKTGGLSCDSPPYQPGRLPMFRCPPCQALTGCSTRRTRPGAASCGCG